MALPQLCPTFCFLYLKSIPNAIQLTWSKYFIKNIRMIDNHTVIGFQRKFEQITKGSFPSFIPLLLMYQAANNLIPNGFLSYLTLFICTKVLHKTYQYNIGKRKAHLQKKNTWMLQSRKMLKSTWQAFGPTSNKRDW